MVKFEVRGIRWDKVSKRSFFTGLIGFIAIFLEFVVFPNVYTIFSIIGFLSMGASIIFQIKDKSDL